MITEAIFGVLAGLMRFLIDLFPDWTAPSWLTTSVETFANAVGHIYLLDNWLPLQAIGHVVVFCLACTAIAFGVKAFRMILSLMTGGGGSAA